MLLSAGVGLSFLFWGMAEPLIHLADPPFGAAEPGSAEAARLAVRYSFLFWGPHAWAIYAVVAISRNCARGYAARTCVPSMAPLRWLARMTRGWPEPEAGSPCTCTRAK